MRRATWLAAAGLLAGSMRRLWQARRGRTEPGRATGEAVGHQGRDHRHRQLARPGRTVRGRIAHAAGESLPDAADDHARQTGAGAGRGRLPVRRADDVHVQPEGRADLPERARAHLVGREVQLRPDAPAEGARRPGRTVLLGGFGDHAGRADRGVHAEEAGRAVAVPADHDGRVDRRRAVLFGDQAAERQRDRQRAVPAEDVQARYGGGARQVQGVPGIASRAERRGRDQLPQGRAVADAGDHDRQGRPRLPRLRAEDLDKLARRRPGPGGRGGIGGDPVLRLPLASRRSPASPPYDGPSRN